MADLALELRTAHLPDVRLTPGEVRSGGEAGGGGSGGPSFMDRVLGWLRPEARIVTPLGNYTWAPNGAPPPTSWPLVPLVAAGVLLVLLVLAGVGVVSLVRR